MVHRLLFLLLLSSFSLFSCDGPSPASEGTEELPATEAPKLIEKEPLEQDVVQYTQEATPEFVAEEELPKRDISVTKSPRSAVTEEAAEEVATEDPSETGDTTEKTPLVSPQPTERVDSGEVTAPTPPDHSVWNEILRQYVSDSGNVYYSRLKNQESKLDAYLADLAKATPDASWSRKAAMAYWINAYNAFTLKRILNNWPVGSIMDLDGGKTWDVKWIELAGSTYSLNQIEHEIIRPEFKDARIHFAVNCAAASCPPLANRAFTADNLDAMLENLARRFINNGLYNQVSKESIRVSKIFDWYGEDFGNLRDYLNKYLKNPLPEDTKIGFRDYDWSLNN